MSAQLSQIDINSDGTAPEFFVQIRVSSGEVPSGSVEFYDSSNTNTATFSSAFTIDLSSAVASNTFSSGGYDYYTFPISGDLLQGNDKNFVVALVSGGGAVESVLMFGTNLSPANVSISGGSLDGETVQTVIDTGVVEGGAFQSGTGPFAVSESGTVSSGPSNPTTPCFAAGTLITIPGGVQAVEDLREGDLVLTARGEAVGILWIGHFTVRKFHTLDYRNTPVRICAGALGVGVPSRDLVVTGDHALYLDGLLIDASVLTNGSSITYVPLDELPDSMTFYHIETERHEIIHANGCPAETYLDAGARRGFDNFEEFFDKFGFDHIIPPMPCPRVSSRRLLPVSFGMGLTPANVDASDALDFGRLGGLDF